MTTDKRLSPAELRRQQEVREAEAREAKDRASEKALADQQARDRAALEKAVNDIKSSWYDKVVAVSQRTGMRFLVLARVIDTGGDAKDLLDDLMATIRASEYQTAVCDLHVQTGLRGSVAARNPAPPDNTESEVTDGKEIGWKPAGIPTFGSSGVLRWLIVKW